MVLYANVNHPNLRQEHPNWSDRIKQIQKIWKVLPNEKRIHYVTRARENRTASRVNEPLVSRMSNYSIDDYLKLSSKTVTEVKNYEYDSVIVFVPGKISIV